MTARYLIASREDRRDDRFQCLAAVAPDRVHLEVAAILLERHRVGSGLAKRRDHLRSREEVGTPCAAPLDDGVAADRLDGLLDDLRRTGLENFDDDASGGRPHVANLPERAVLLPIALNGLFQISNRGRGALVREAALRRGLDRRQVLQLRRNGSIQIALSWHASGH